ncbi:MAG: heat-inducible transcriptional repressor HrcA [Chloroflexota bacterium]|nr:heat-inducible transcriptional repressor HrcA [Chloroflexota bacterium]
MMTETQDTQPTKRKLKPRQRDILKALVQEYISTADPVGSETVRRVGQLEVSSATIRNELATLEKDGYVYQPYTSAGRVPTVEGYRYFVEELMDEVSLPLPQRRMIGHQFHQMRLNLDQWMSLTAAILAHTARAASLVTPPHAKSAYFKHLELIGINDAICLMILVLRDGSIHQEMLGMADPIDQETLTQTSRKLNELLKNCSAKEIKESDNPELGALEGLTRQVLGRVVDIMESIDCDAITKIYRDGLENMFCEPEFRDAEKMQQLIEIQQHHSLLEPILTGILNSNGIQVIIGGEGPYEEIEHLSLVLSRYGIRDRASGVLGIMGPRRMPYGRAISTVRYVTRLMDDLISSVYGHDG